MGFKGLYEDGVCFETTWPYNLNPIEAQIDITLAVLPAESLKDDIIGLGALKYSNLVKEAQAIANLKNVAVEISEFIPF